MQEENNFNSNNAGHKPTPTNLNQVELGSTKFNLVQPGSTNLNQPRPTSTDSDKEQRWLTLDKVEKIFVSEGIPRSRVVLGRYCRQGRLRGIKDEGRNGEEWYVDPDSIPIAIAELKRINGLKGTEGEPADLNQPQLTPTDLDQGATSPADAPAKKPTKTEPEPKLPAESDLNSTPTPKKRDLDQPKPTPTDHSEIENHPLVKHLKGEVQDLKSEVRHWQSEFKDQVKVTETIQQRANDQLIELQKLVHVGNSSILADFFLKAKQLIGLTPGDDLPETEDVPETSPRKKAKKVPNDA